MGGQCHVERVVGGQARHLRRCDKEPPGAERVGRSSSKTVLVASGEVPRLPARDDLWMNIPMFIIVPRSESIRLTNPVFRSPSLRLSSPPSCQQADGARRVGDQCHVERVVGGHARHLGRCDKESPGEERVGRSSNKAVLVASGEVPRLPFRPPARDDNRGRVREGISGGAGIHSPGQRPLEVPVVIVMSSGWWAGKRDISVDATRNLQAKSVSGRSSNKAVLVASGEVPRLPFRPPARDDNRGRVREGISGGAGIHSPGQRPLEVPVVSVMSSGWWAGKRDISADATRNLQAQSVRCGRPAKRSFSHRGRSLACPSARPLGTTCG